MIKLKDVNKVYRTKEIETLALENVNLDIKEGEFVSIMGPSGCGKSTLLNIIGLLDTPTSGTVKIMDKMTADMNDSQLSAFRNANIGFVFQSFHLIPSLNVSENVALPLVYRHGVSASERHKLVDDVLRRLGLSHRMRHLPGQLSGGQC
ncbi:MAG: ATP-binding cassette domain-containing protein, partial [Muribaculaceae bacterium]|nr:ATP-binding cassette domain-containing protein [Muribaculaceae bacterium]